MVITSVMSRLTHCLSASVAPCLFVCFLFELLNYCVSVSACLNLTVKQHGHTLSHTFAFPVALRRHLFPSFAPSVNMCSSVTYLSLLQSQCLPVPPVCEGSCYDNTKWQKVFKWSHGSLCVQKHTRSQLVHDFGPGDQRSWQNLSLSLWSQIIMRSRKRCTKREQWFKWK